MNGNEVATLRSDIAVVSNDVKHLVEKVGEQTEVLKDREPRLRHLEDHCIETTSWRSAHEKEHTGISEQLGELKTDVKDIKEDMSDVKETLSSINGGNKKTIIKGSAIGGVTLAGLFELGKQVIELLK